MYYVYLLQTGDKTYTGCTSQLEKRIERHKKGYVPATKNFIPVKLLFYAAFESKDKAFEFEKYLKSGSGRSFIKKRLIDK